MSKKRNEQTKTKCTVSGQISANSIVFAKSFLDRSLTGGKIFSCPVKPKMNDLQVVSLVCRMEMS
jgi:hypothetical protein